MTDKKPWDADISHVHDEIVGAQTLADGPNFAIAAVALALIDRGLIDKGRLLDIIESLRSILHLDYELKLGDARDAEVGLNFLATFVGGSEWKPNEVLEQLQQEETAALAVSLLRAAQR